MLMKVENLCKAYPDLTIFSQLNLEVKQGEIISLVGPSGCGKTTLLRCIAGLEETTSGCIFLQKQEITDVKTEKRPVVMMFQQPLLFPHMTILENVTYGLRHQKNKLSKKDRKEKGMAILEKVELAGLAKRYPHQLSGGQQQRVALARAMIMNPKVLLLDEPFSSLDPALRSSLRSWVRAFLKKEGVTALFVTHDREEAMTMGDRIVVMKEGKIQQIGTPEEVYRKPANPYVADMFAEGLKIDGRFIPAEKLTLTTLAAPLKQGENQCEATVLQKFFKYGQSFYKVYAEEANQEITLHCKEELQLGAKVTIAYRLKDSHPFQRSGASERAGFEGGEAGSTRQMRALYE